MMKAWMAGLAAALLLAAQTAAPPALDKPGLEAYFRHLLMWPPSVEMTIGDPAPAPMPGFYRVNVHGARGGNSRDEPFYVSADSKTIIRGEILDTTKSPFQADIDLLKTDDQPFLGTPGAPVTIVEFADFQCPYCQKAAGVLRKDLMEAFPGEIQLYFMDFPLDPIHPFARGAAVMGRCIYNQNNASFWGYHDWIFEHQGEITADKLRDRAMEYAKTDRNLDPAKLAACTVSPEPRTQVDRTQSIGNALKITATPTFFINGRRMVGAIGLDELKMVVSHEIAWAKAHAKPADCCSVQLALPGTAPADGKAPSK
jgi:protein-disulfide isomerase